MQDDLIARIEAAEGPDAMVDLGIYQAITGREGIVRCMGREGISADVPAYTVSLDAAATLIPAGWWWSTGNCSISADASCGPDVAHCSKDLLVRFDDGIHVELDQPSTPALALCAVALRAVAAIRATPPKPDRLNGEGE